MRKRDLGPKSLWCVHVVLVAESLRTRVGEPSLTRGRRRTVRGCSLGEEKEEVKKSALGGRPLLSLLYDKGNRLHE
jgi:hypothetical protein